MRTKINLILGALIALVSGCKTQEEVKASKNVIAIYGVPYATYEVNGSVVDKKNKPVEGAKVVVKGENNRVIGDTVITNKKGNFELIKSAYPTNTLNIVVCDPQDDMPIDSVQHNTSYKKDNEERGFYNGKCTISTKVKIK